MEENNLEQEIKDAIARNLPAQVGDALQTQLERLKSLEKQKVNADTLLAERDETIRALSESKHALQTIVDKHAELNKRESEISERERNYKVAILETQLASEKRVSDAYLGFVNTLVRNAVVKEQFTKGIVNSEFYTNSGAVKYPVGENTSVTREVE